MTTLPNHHPMLGGLTNKEYISLTGAAKAYVPMLLLLVVVGGGGTRGVCLGGEDDSARSTLRYVSRESPRDVSGSQARRKEEALVLLAEEAEVARSNVLVGEGFCWMRAMKPGMLSLDDGVG